MMALYPLKIMRHSFLFAIALLLYGCGGTGTEIVVPEDSGAGHYQGEATVLVGVEGHGKRALRHLEISTAEAPEGYAIYFHDKKPSHGLVAVKVKAPSTHVRLSEYSLTGFYGCSRGKLGYGYGADEIARVEPGKTYFLTTVNTAMNTTYAELSRDLAKEAKMQYGYSGIKREKSHRFKSHIELTSDSL